jgi:translation initiation factor IF-3
MNKNTKKEYFRINTQIRSPQVRLVGENITPGVYDIQTALKFADDLNTDLVEISPTAVPPVCKIVDYNKFLYDRKKKQKEVAQSQSKTKLKEIRFTPTTGEHDYQFKMKQALEFLTEKNKVKIGIFFSGRMINNMELGKDIIERLLVDLNSIGKPESDVKMEGKRLTIIFTPK